MIPAEPGDTLQQHSCRITIEKMPLRLEFLGFDDRGLVDQYGNCAKRSLANLSDPRDSLGMPHLDEMKGILMASPDLSPDCSHQLNHCQILFRPRHDGRENEPAGTPGEIVPEDKSLFAGLVHIDSEGCLHDGIMIP
jgi:hypothetical protein